MKPFGFRSMVLPALGTVLVLFCVRPSGAADATATCAQTIIKAGAAYQRAKTNALRKCEEAVVKGKSDGPCPNQKTTDVVDKAVAKFDTAVKKACGGKNKTCDPADSGKNVDVPLDQIGWDVGHCSAFGVVGCNNPIATCNDIPACVQCLVDTTVNDSLNLYYGALTDTDPAAQKDLNKCQVAIGKEASIYALAKAKALAGCRTRVSKGKALLPCPDGRAVTAIGKARDKLAKNICKACGGKDKACDDTGDPDVNAIGFPASCPAVASCSAPITSVAALVTCVACVTDVNVETADSGGVPGQVTPKCAEAAVARGSLFGPLVKTVWLIRRTLPPYRVPIRRGPIRRTAASRAVDPAPVVNVNASPFRAGGGRSLDVRIPIPLSRALAPDTTLLITTGDPNDECGNVFEIPPLELSDKLDLEVEFDDAFAGDSGSIWMALAGPNDLLRSDVAEVTLPRRGRLRQVADLEDGGDSDPNLLTDVNSRLFFVAEIGVQERLFALENATAVPTTVLNQPAGDEFLDLTAVGQSLFFGFTANDGSPSLWRANGTPPAAVQVADVTSSCAAAATAPIALGNKLIFGSSTDEAGCELWASDGAAGGQGTVQLKDIRVGKPGSEPSQLVVLGNVVFFVANDGVNGEQVWRTDGTTADVTRVTTFPVGSRITELTPLGNALYFVLNDIQLKRLDPPITVTDVGAPFQEIGHLTRADDRLYFEACDDSNGCELWRLISGTPTRVSDIGPGAASGGIGALTPVGTSLFFRACTAGAGCELWRTDGTPVGTQLVADIAPGSGTSFPTDLRVIGGRVFFEATDGARGREIWESDGSEEGTVRVRDFRIGEADASAFRGSPVAVDKTLFFPRDDGQTGVELWSLVAFDGVSPPATPTPGATRTPTPVPAPTAVPNANCCSSRVTGSCQEASCAACVCAIDAVCCTTAWDQRCVAQTTETCASDCSCFAPSAAIAYRPSVQEGDSFLVTESGLYSISTNDYEPTVNLNAALSVNSTQLNFPGSELTPASRLAPFGSSGTTGTNNNAAVVTALAAGDIVRLHSNARGTDPFSTWFRMTQVASGPVDVSEIYLEGGNGQGSNNVAIRRFANTVKEVGDAITYVPSATNGDSFVINENGLYAISVNDYDPANLDCAISRNSNQLTALGSQLLPSTRLAPFGSDGTTGTNNGVAIVTALEAGDVIRLHSVASGTDPFSVWIRLTQVASGPISVHESYVEGGNGHGSVNTAVRRFTSQVSNVGSAISYVSSATQGDSFIIGEDGLYAVSAGDYDPDNLDAAVSRNSTQLTAIGSQLVPCTRLGVFGSSGTTGTNNSVAVVTALSAGDVLRLHTATSSTEAFAVWMRVTKVASSPLDVHELYLEGGSGYGTLNSTIRRFTNVVTNRQGTPLPVGTCDAP